MPERHIVLKNAGVIDPRRLDSYLDAGGFAALGKCAAR